MKNNNFILLLLLTIITFSGCTVSRKLSFEDKQAGPDYNMSKTAAVAFIDQRPNVLSGRSKPSLCGHIKSTVQISYNVQTKDAIPLSDEFAQSVSNSYSKAGEAATAINVGTLASQETVIAAFKKDSKDRLLLFSIKEWDARGTPGFSTIRYEIICEFVLQVYNKNGELLASDSTHDMLAREQGVAVSVKQLQAIADEELGKQINILFNKEAIRNSL
jgi:hypothetical protein